MGLQPGGYAVVTLHRPSNVDQFETLAPLVDQLIEVSSRLAVVFAVHPRTRKQLEAFGLLDRLRSVAPDVGSARRRGTGIHMTEPLGYIQFMNLVLAAKLAITDSGGIQEESTYLGIPCLTLRENTERPITVTQGTNRLVRPTDLLARVNDVLEGRWATGRRPDLWDGRTAQRCAAALKRRAGA